MRKGFLVWWGSKKGSYSVNNVQLKIPLCPKCQRPRRIKRRQSRRRG